MTILVVYSLIQSVVLATSYAAGYVEGGVSTGESVAGPRFEPQVAMVCAGRSQYHAQYMTQTGRWVTDTQSKVTCLKDKVDILRYCKQVYPERDITNIVESSHYYKVPNFCRVGHAKCKASVWVKPYRCLEGSFQSDALLVPEGCLFDHIHNQSRCWEFDRWNITAELACGERRMALKSFAMLLPCGIDVFSGVEFVCCPKNYKGRSSKDTPSTQRQHRPEPQPLDHEEIEEPVALPQTDRRAMTGHHAGHGQPPSTPTPSPHLPPTTTTTPQEVGTRDEYFSRFDPHEEHDAFRRAEQRLEERHRQKVSKIMKEWSELEERYQDLRARDPHKAEEFKHRMTQRFQQTVEAVEAENEAERHQLTALHQQRIVAHINEMKREAMTCYTRALADRQPNTHRVQKCLQKLLRALNKDRHHTVSHYKHLLNSDFEAADRERDSTLQHLSDLERMVNQSLNMLSRHPELNAKIGRLMREYSSALRSKYSTPPELVTHAPPPVQETQSDVEPTSDEGPNDDSDEQDEDDNDDVDDDAADEDEDEDEDDYETTKNEDEDYPDSDEETYPEDDDVVQPQASQDPASHAQDPTPDPQSQDPATPATSNTSAQTPAHPSRAEAAILLHQEEVQVAHAQHHSLSHPQASFSVTHERGSSEGRGVYYTLAFAGVALMTAMVVGIVVLRRRNSTSPHNQGFMEVDQAITPEERHVANMQVNGYENPTYKYFEEK